MVDNELCLKCKLHETSCVGPKFAYRIMGVGPKPCDIMIIGEAPGQQEVLEDTPFVGDAGKLLNEGLKNAGIDRCDVYITNTVKCRPPENRAPSKPECKYCLPNLLEEIKEVKPKIICLLGGVALEAVVKMKGITRIRGNVFDVEIDGEKYKVLPTWHPAYVIRFPEYKDLRNEFMKDLNLLKQVSTSTNYIKERAPVNYTIVQDGKDTVKVLDYIAKIEQVGYFSYDIETTGFKFLTDKILCLSLSCAIQEGISMTGKFLNENPLVYSKLKSILESKTLLKIAHHSKFDNKFLKTFGIDVKLPIFDTMYAHYLLDENSLHGLKDLAWRFTDMGGYDADVKYDDFNEEAFYSKEEFRVKTMEYNCADADCTVRMYQKFLPELEKENLKKIHDLIIMPLQVVLQETEYSGVPIDVAYMDKYEKELTAKIEDLEFQLTNLSSVKEAEVIVNKGLVPTDKKYQKFNFDSSKQLQVLLFQVEKCTPIKATKTGFSTDADTLEALRKQSPSVKMLLEYRKAVHIRGTYIEQMRHEMDANNRVHTDYKLHGSVSGRIISEKPNLQNIPRGPEVKRFFIAEPNCVLLEADYSQIEYRVWANLADDQDMLADIKKGLDIHSEACCYMWPMIYKKVGDKEYLHIPTGKVYDKVGDEMGREGEEHRTKAKNVIFGVTYGRGIKSLVEEFGLTEIEARDLMKWILNRYPKARQWIENQRVVVRKQKFVYNMFGRKRRLPTIDSNDEKTRSDAERQAVNTPVQSSASDIMSIATIRIYNLLKNKGLHAKLFFTIHDSVKYNIPVNELDDTLEAIKEGLSAPIKGVNFPLASDYSIGTNWGEMIKYKNFEKDREGFLRKWGRN